MGPLLKIIYRKYKYMLILKFCCENDVNSPIFSVSSRTFYLVLNLTPVFNRSFPCDFFQWFKICCKTWIVAFVFYRSTSVNVSWKQPELEKKKKHSKLESFQYPVKTNIFSFLHIFRWIIIIFTPQKFLFKKTFSSVLSVI